ncbi:hypothetical protein C1646_742083 [Rhizophagus diaphanus]|nr:hypothetical protein C1646_742083 [Rhizophagus diaphanus] [Rhizophagus sp. MUCL 43196]
MHQKSIIIVCSGGPSGLIFALSLSEVLVTKRISGKILLFHEDYNIRKSKNQFFSVNETEILRLPQSVRDHISPTYSMHEFEDLLLELIKKLPEETVQLIHERFDPAQDFRFDLLVLANGYDVNFCDSLQFEKEVISNNYELEINFNLTENHLQNSEIEILLLYQTRYLIQFQQNNQNFLRINLSKSEFDNIELDHSSNSINPWFTNIIHDGFRFFGINNYNLVSNSKSSDSLLVTKEFYKSYQHAQYENFVCVIGGSAFNCKAWQNKSMNFGIAISTAMILAEQLAIDQEISFKITRSILDGFSNSMLNFQIELANTFQLRSMDNILTKVMYDIVDYYNQQYPEDQLSINFDFMSTSKNNPHKSNSVFDELKKDYLNNIKISAPEIFFKKLDRVQNECVELSQSSILRDFDSKSNKSPDQKIQKIENDSISSEDSDDSSDNEIQPESLSLEEFFQLTFGDEVISYDATNFVVDELTKEIFKAKVKSCLNDPTKGILRNIFPYIIDIINRTIPLRRIQDCIRQISDSKEPDNPQQVLKRLANCKGRDYLVAFLDKVPKKALSKILLSLTRANIPIPLLFTNKNDFNQKGLRVLKEIQSLIFRDKYHLLLSFNLTTSELTTPFSKMLYPNICKHREDGFSITSAGSIDISFHSASENYGRKPVAIAEIYFEETPHQTFLSLISSFSQFAFYMFLHVNDQDFEGNSPSSELNQLLNTILAGSNDPHFSKISAIYWNKSKKNNDPFSKRKKTLKKLLEPHFNSECIKIEQIPSDLNQFTEKKKDDVMRKLTKLETKTIHPLLVLKLLDGRMASTAQKYFTHRTSFDEKITLLALMCSQIVIINAKGLTRDIGDILEVSSWHLDALRHRQSKPRLHFVLRDMIDMIEAQEPAFKDIVDGLKKTFEQIPGCVGTLEDYMSVEQQDVHLLDNAFCCYQDDFRPRVANIGKTENVNLPAEVFPAKISSLRRSLLKSALLQQNTSEQFTNIQGFIPYMKTVWNKINTYGSFLHFENFKAIQAWYQMRNIVSDIKENKLLEFTTNSKIIINDYVTKIKSDYSKWDQIETEFRKELVLLTDKWTKDNLKNYLELVQEQFDINTVEEGKRLIYNMITEERREQESQWMLLIQEYKDSWLSECAVEKVGKRIKGLNTTNLEKNEAECKKIFEEIWKEVEDDKIEFNRQMVLQPEELEQYVQLTFVNAVNEFGSTVRQGSKQKEKEKFKRDFWTSIKKSSTLEKHIRIDVEQIQNIIEINTHFNFFKKDVNKREIAEKIESKLRQTINGITYDLERKLSLHIEYGQAIKWLGTLCDCLFEFTQSLNNKIEFKSDLDFFEKYLRSQIYKTLKNNTIKWENKQKEKLDSLKKNLLSSFQKILTDFSNESLSKEVLKYILVAFRQQLDMKEKTIDQKLRTYLKKGWMDTNTAANHAYSQSFGACNINAIREYLKNPTEYMSNLFNTEYDKYSEVLIESVLREIDEYYINIKDSILNGISEWNELFDPNQSYDQLPLSKFFLYLSGHSISQEYDSLRIFMQHKYNVNIRKPVQKYDLFEILKDSNNLLGSFTIEKPVDFCNLLCKSLIECLTNMQTTWTNTERFIAKEKIRAHLVTKNTLMSYWNQLGCSERCPLCSSKCELPDDGHTQHQVSKHLLPAFTGFHKIKTRFPTLIICTEDEAHNSTWRCDEDSINLPLAEFLSKYHPSWLPFPRSEPSDEHVAKMRAIWWKLKDELCEEHDMIDNTDPSWGSIYGSLIPE